MNNIFTFNIEEDEQINESEQIDHQTIKEKILQPNPKINNSPFTFDDFDQFQEGQLDKTHSKLSRQENVENKQNEWRLKRSNKKIKKLISKHNEPQQQNDKHETKKQLTAEIMPGLEVEDLGTNQMEYVCEKKALKVTDMQKFLYTPMGDYKVKAIIKKLNGGIFNLNNKFHVFIQQNNRFIFSISREGLSEYIFSLQKNNISQKKKSYLGKMCSNIAGTEFLMFDNGFSPKQTRSLQCCRKQIASIKYEPNSGPRKFTTIISTNCQGFYALEQQQNILFQKWQKKQRDYLSILHSRAPEFDPEDGNYKLDFKGIVKKASVKNFILGGMEWDDSLIFGKIDNQTYVMQIKEPLSVLQAAGICISSIHYKLHWR